MEILPGSLIHGMSFILGLICGSFTTTLSYRLPRREDFVNGRSRCPKCRTNLGPLDLIPVISWLVFRGKCRHCNAPISARYPYIEFVCGSLFVLVSLSFVPGQPEQAVILWVLAVLLLTLSIIDLEQHRLPNSLIMLVLGLGLSLVWVTEQSFVEAGAMSAAALAVGLLARFAGQMLSHQPGIGWDDIKLVGALSLGIPFDSVIVFLGAFGLALIILVAEFGWRRHLPVVPLGPALCFGAFAALL